MGLRVKGLGVQGLGVGLLGWFFGFKAAKNPCLTPAGSRV